MKYTPRASVRLVLATALLLMSLVIAMASNSAATSASDVAMRETIDRAQIIDVVNAVAVTADRRDWAACRRQFMDVVDMDYTSLVGGKPTTTKADDLIAGWEKGLSVFKVTQHQITNHQVTIHGDTAEVLAYVHALHYLPTEGGDGTWELSGFYNDVLVRTASGWKIKAMKLTKTYARGNAGLMGAAGNAGVQNESHK